MPAGAASTLTVRALNVLFKLRTRRYRTSWSSKKISEVAEDIKAGQFRVLGVMATERSAFIPNAEVTIYPWKDSPAHVDAVVEHARSFLKKNMEAFFFKKGGEEDVDTTKKGTIAW